MAIPELPEVETFKRYIERTSLNMTVKKVQVGNAIVLGKTSMRELREAVEGSSFRSVHRIGKHLLVELSGGGWLTLHFGMTGEPVFFSDRPPRFARVTFSFQEGALAFDDPRMLGRVGFATTVEEFVRRKRLGPDALSISKKDFLARFGKTRGAIKPALLDQHKLAGIGNLYADEVLFQSRLDPRAELVGLSCQDLEAVYKNMKKVLKLSIANGSDLSKLPPTYLLSHRRRGAPCPGCGGTTEIITLGGRTTYFCPKCQVRGGR